MNTTVGGLLIDPAEIGVVCTTSPHKTLTIGVTIGSDSVISHASPIRQFIGNYNDELFMWSSCDSPTTIGGPSVTKDPMIVDSTPIMNNGNLLAASGRDSVHMHSLEGIEPASTTCVGLHPHIASDSLLEAVTDMNKVESMK